MIELVSLKKKHIPQLMKIMKENNDTTRDRAKTMYLKNIKSGVEFDFVVLLNKSPIGVIGYCKEKGRYTLTWFHLQKQYQNKGYGSEALRKLEQIISKHAPCEIQADTGYPRAVNFYKRHGYKLVKTMPNFYPAGGPNIILRKRL